MKSICCTLFEGNYHYGVAALINSVYENGFIGDFYIGYKGELPLWTSNVVKVDSNIWQNGVVYVFAENCNIHFLPIETTMHMTNYKPEFLIKLSNLSKGNFDGLFYFDPDIVIKCRWSFFEKWIEYGVALVHEVVSNDLPNTHPFRHEWREIASKVNLTNSRVLTSYINAGFIGLKLCNIDFVKNWGDILNLAIKTYNYDGKQLQSLNRTYSFNFFDQDALNAAAMCSGEPISEMGPEAMDFVNAGWTMSHATGSPKPWKKKFLISALLGIPPTKAEKEYWRFVKGIINPYSNLYIKRKNVAILISSFIGRFYKRR